MILRPGQAIGRVLRCSFQFRGRARRSEYWWWALFVILLEFAVLAVESRINLRYIFGISTLDWTVTALYFTPDLSVGWRRLQDTGRPGWLYPIFSVLAYAVLFLPEPFQIVASGPLETGFLQMFGWVEGLNLLYFLIFIVMIALLAMPSQSGDNRYGPHPYEDRGASVFD